LPPLNDPPKAFTARTVADLLIWLAYYQQEISAYQRGAHVIEIIEKTYKSVKSEIALELTAAFDKY
jgi:hypothetical protein